MAFDFGFDFRATAPFVTDPLYAVPVLGESFPNTYTNANGLSINAGWTGVLQYTGDRVNTNDARIAGINGSNNGAGARVHFTIDLSSGSAPGSGTYTMDAAMGDAGNTPLNAWGIFDGSNTGTLIIDATNGGNGYSLAAGQYVDASLATVSATTTWTGTPVSKVVSTTTVTLDRGTDVGGFSTIAHFRLTLAGGTITTITPNTGSVVSVGYQPTLTGQMQITTVFSNLGDQGFIAFQAQVVNKVEASLDGVTYHDITALGRAVTGAILFSHVAFFFYRVTSVGAIVYTTGTDKAVIN